MKMYIFSVLLSFSLFCCDPIIYLDTNGQEKYDISSDCGKIEISSAVLTGKLGIVLIPTTINGSLEVDTDSLKIVLLPEEQYQNAKIYSSHKYKKTNGKFVVEKNEGIYIGFDSIGYFVPPILTNPPSIMILPCSYITCNGKPLITDTIRIEFKENRFFSIQYD